MNECCFVDLPIYDTRDGVHQRLHASADVSGSLPGRGACVVRKTPHIEATWPWCIQFGL